MNPGEKAKEIIIKYDVRSPTKLNLEEIANAENLIVEEIDMNECLGKIIYEDGYGLIKINCKAQEQRQKRFTIAHELGHYYNEKDALTRPLPKGEGKCARVYKCTTLDMYSFKSPKIYENEANEFAAELLMHKPWFGKFIKERKVSMELMKEIAEYFGVSLTASSLRYSTIGKYPVALIMSEAGKVKWSSINEYFPYKWIPNGYQLREESSAFDYFKGNEVQTEADLIPAYTWFSEDYKCEKDKYLFEQNIVMKNYQSVLTLLWEQKK